MSAPEQSTTFPAELRNRFLEPAPGAIGRMLVGTHAALILTYGLALWAGSWLGYAVALLVAVAVQTHMAVLMHEGAHWLVDPDKLVNDRLTNWLAAYPIGMTVERYRRNHLLHHARLGTSEDPDFSQLCVPPVQSGVGASIAKALTLSGWRPLQMLFKYLERESPAAERTSPAGVASLAGRATWQVLLFGVAALAGQPWAYVIVWLLPLLTAAVMINDLRTIIEHTPLVEVPPSGSPVRLDPVTRTVRAGWLGKLFVGPLNFHYHHEHHLAPATPFSRLPELHRELVASGYYEQNPHLLCDGYPGILRAIWRRYRPERAALTVSVAGGAFIARRA